MGYILYTPSWFFGIDSIFEFISVFVTIFIGYYSYKIYKLVSDKKYFYFSLSFMFIAISFIARAVIILLISLKWFEFDVIADKIAAVGYGSTRPLASNKTAKGRAVNRRIDVIIKPQTLTK